MLIFQELAKGYANRIRESFTSHSSYRKSTSNLRSSEVLKEVKAVKKEIDDLVYTQSKKPLSDVDKTQLIEQIYQELGLPRKSQTSYAISESASNDDLMDLADEIENILSSKK